MRPALPLPALILLTSLALPFPALAQAEGLLSLAARLMPHRDPGPVLMTRETFLDRRGALFETRDTNGDGILDPQEQADNPLPAPVPGAGGLLGEVQQAMQPDHVDANGDKHITRGEFDAASERLFALFDTDGDGQITAGDSPQP